MHNKNGGIKMKKILAFLCIFILMFALVSCAGQRGKQYSQSSEPSASQAVSVHNSEQEETVSEPSSIAADNKSTNVLVSYFSATGNTRTLAKYAADAMGADLYEIVPEDPYTDEDLDYGNNGSRTTVEQNDETARPAIFNQVENMEQYDIIFLGYPIWWRKAPRIVYTFMETYDFNGKTVIPFCTSSSSDIGSSAHNLHALTFSDVTWLDGDRLSSNSTRDDMVDWINSLGLDVTAE